MYVRMHVSDDDDDSDVDSFDDRRCGLSGRNQNVMNCQFTMSRPEKFTGTTIVQETRSLYK